jgi:hypothetical protein
MELNGRKVINASVDGVDSGDYPDFCDAYFSYAVFEDTKEALTDVELEELGDKYGDVINEMAHGDCVGAAEDRYDYLNDR